MDEDRTFEWPELRNIPPLFLSAVNSAYSDLGVYYRSGSIVSLRNWISRLRAIVETREFQQSEPDFQAGMLYRYGIGLQWLGVHSGQTSLFDAALKAWGETVSLTPARSPLNIRSRYNLAISAVNRHRFSGAISTLDQAISLLRNCADDAGNSQSELALCLEGISLAYERRHISAGQPEDLDLAVKAAQRSVEVSGGAGSTRRVRYMCRLATTLRARYRSSGNIDDLDDAIAIYSDLNQTVPHENAEWAIFMGDAASAWRMRHEQTGRRDDLEAAAAIDEMRLQHTSADSLNYEIALNSHGITMQRLFVETGKKEYLDEWVKNSEASVALVHRDHTHFPTNSNNLGNALFARYRYSKQIADLNDCIRSYEFAVAKASPRAQAYPMYVSNLGVAMMERYNLDPDSGVVGAIDSLLEEACSKGVQKASGIVLPAAISWGKWHQDWNRLGQAARAFNYGMQAAISLFQRQDSSLNKNARLHQMSQLPAASAYCNAHADRLEDAVLALEQGRALVLGEALEKDTVVNRLLSDGHEEIAQIYLNSITTYNLVIKNRANR